MGGLYFKLMNIRRFSLLPIGLLLLFAASEVVYAQGTPTVNQCRTQWQLTTNQDMDFGAFSADAGVGTITMDRFGGRSTAGQVSLSTSVPATTWNVNVVNTLSPACATYGFTLDLRRAPRPLRGPGANIPLGNIRVTVPAYGITDGVFPQVIPASPANTAPFTMTIYGEITVTHVQDAGDYTRNLVVQLSQNNRNRRTRTTVSATSIVPLSITELVSMDFGTLAAGPVAGTVVLGTGSGRTASGDVQLLASGPGTAGQFQLTGEAGQTYSVSFSSGVLASGVGNLMTLNAFSSNASGTVPGSGNETFEVGGTLNVGSNQPAGSYSTLNGGGSPYTVTVNYN